MGNNFCSLSFHKPCICKRYHQMTKQRLNTSSEITQNLFLLNNSTHLLSGQRFQTTHTYYGPELISFLNKETVEQDLGTSLFASKFNVLALDFLRILMTLLTSSCRGELFYLPRIFVIWYFLGFCLAFPANFLLLVFAAFLVF